MDFRNPRLNEYMVVQEQGVTNYLSSNDLDLNDLIVKHDGYKNFHILSAGAIPLILQSYEWKSRFTFENFESRSMTISS
jgi:hypothetical protein